MTHPSVLVVKTSSMGDLVHTLPAVSDLARAWPGVQIDWVAEEGFAAIPALHPAVRQVIPVALRRWRRQWRQAGVRSELHTFFAHLRGQNYDHVIDCQGLVKSAVIAKAAHGPAAGYGWKSAREPLASLFYRRKLAVARDLPAIQRNRLAFAAAFGTDPHAPPDFQAQVAPLRAGWLTTQPYVVLMPSASRPQKLWPEEDWVKVGDRLAEAGMSCVIVWGSPTERARADRLASRIAHTQVAEPMQLNEAAALLAGCQATVGLDSGLTHLAAALGKPTIGIFCDHSTALTPVTGSAYCASLGGKGTPPSLQSVLQAVEDLLGATAHG